jgi:hypothetical protein
MFGLLIEKAKQENWEETLIQCHLAHHESHLNHPKLKSDLHIRSQSRTISAVARLQEHKSNDAIKLHKNV